MHEMPAAWILSKPGGGVLVREEDPRRVHFERHQFGIGLLNEKIHQSACGVREELVTMRVVKEADVLLCALCTGAVEHDDRVPRIGFFEISQMINPGRARVLEPQSLGLDNDVGEVVLPAIVGKMAADGL